MSANAASHSVSITEIGVLGARLEHDREIGAAPFDLEFKYENRPITLRCEVVRTFPAREPGGRMQSGVRFLSAVADSGDLLRNMLAQLVRREFAMRRRTPTLQMPSPVDGDKTVRGKDAMFLCYRLDGNIWRKRRVFLPEQPSVGFTVATAVDGEELNRLCMVYEASDAEGRRLIRLFAELSISDAMEIPPTA